MRVRMGLVSLALAVALFALAACGAKSSPSPTPTGAATSDHSGLDVGQKAPLFTAKLVSGQPVTLESLRGKIVLLNFWATWCGPCRGEMPFLQALADKYDKKDFAVLAVNFLEQPDTIAKFTNQFNLKFDVVLDPKGEINRLYGVNHYPVTFIVGRDGTILAQQSGPFSPPETLETALKKWIAG